MANFSGANEFLVTNESGQQTGFFQTGKNYHVNNIPDSSYDWQSGITNQLDKSRSISGTHLLQVNPAENGKYTLQVFAFFLNTTVFPYKLDPTPGPYGLNLTVVYGPNKEKAATISGVLGTGGIDKYVFNLPDWSVQKIRN